MKKTALFNLIFLLFFVILSGCAPMPEPKNKWQYDAVSAIHKFKTHFLQNQLDRAKADLSHARDFASQSAHLQTRIDVELSACAMQLGVLQATECKEAAALLALDSDSHQLAYLHLLTSRLTENEITLLPKQYRSFAQSLLSKDTKEINDTLKKITPVSSRLIASALSINTINDKNIQGLIDELSYHGYKNPLIAWMHVQMNKEKDPAKKARLKAKLEVLTSD